jgi:hypothetical protein
VAKKKSKKTSSGRPTKTSRHRKDVCFVIMPFGGWLDDYYETIYRPAIEAAGLAPHRADDLYRPSTIVNDIWAYTKKAKLLIADLTSKNPNVFYELGLAHALAKPAILVAESIDDIPFDLRALRVIIYNKNDPRWGEQLQTKIEAAIAEVMSAPQEAVLPAFLHVRESSGVPKVTPREKDIIGIKQEIELLRREVRRRSPRDDTDGMGPEDARALVETLAKRRMPVEMIVRRLRALGVPERWTRHQVRMLRIRRNRTLGTNLGATPSITALEHDTAAST